MTKRGACLALAGLACWLLLVDEGEAQKVVGRHPGSIMQAALSADGKLLATGDTNGFVRLSDARTGRTIHLTATFHQEVDWLAFKGGDRYLAGYSFLDLRIWDAASGEMKTVSRELDRVRPFAFSPDGRTVAAKNWDNPIRLWDVETGELKRELAAVNEDIESLVFSHDGRLVAGAGDEGVYIWDAATGQLKTRFLTPVDSREYLLRPNNYRIAFLPDNRSIASLTYTRYDQSDVAAVHIWDAATGREQFEFGGYLTRARFAPDGSALTAYSGGRTGLWDLKTGEELAAFEEGFNQPVFSPDSRVMATSKYNRDSGTTTIQIWDVEARALASVIESRDQDDIFLSSKGLLLTRMIMLLREAEFTRFDIQGQKTAQFLVAGSSEIASLSFSPDGRFVASSCEDGWLTDSAIRIWDVSTAEEKRRIKAYAGPSAFSPDGRTVACVSPNKYAIGVWNAETGEQIVELRGHSPSSLAYSPDGKTIAFNENMHYKKEVVRFLDISTGEAVEALTAPSGRAFELTFSQDGTVLAAAGGKGSVHLWDMETREILQTVEGVESVNALALSPSGGSIAVGGKDSIARVWSAKNGALRGKMIGHEGAVHAVAYSPDGARIASGGKDGTVRIWSAKTFQLETTFRGHVGWVNAVAFSPDSRSLISGGKDGRVLLWRLENQPVFWSDAKRPNEPLFFQNALLPNYPNPFNPETWIPFDLAQESAVTITIYDSAGQTVRRLELGELPMGSYRAKEKAAYWDGRNDLGASAASGVYFVRIEAGGFSETRRMVLLK